MKEQVTYKKLTEKINTKAWSSPVPKHIIDNCYVYFCTRDNQWFKHHDDEFYYVIGLSEDDYDYYWLCINNKEKKLKFITCCYDIDKPTYVDKKWNYDERNMIIKEVKNYFKYHSANENLIYLDKKLLNE